MEIQKVYVLLLTDEKEELNKARKQSLKNLIESYQNCASNKIQMVEDDLEGVKVEVRDGIKKVND